MSSFSILSGSGITRGMITEAVQLDRITYDDVYQIQADACFEYFDRNNDIYSMAVDNGSGRVIGYINFSPVREEAFWQLYSGSVIDTVITGEDVLPYEDGVSCRGYFSSIVVHPEHRRRGVAARMLLRWSDLILRLAAQRSIYFKGIVADAVSDTGERLLSEMGFSFVGPSTHGSKIMTLDLFSEDVGRSKYNDKVLDAYREFREGNGLQGMD